MTASLDKKLSQRKFWLHWESPHFGRRMNWWCLELSSPDQQITVQGTFPSIFYVDNNPPLNLITSCCSKLFQPNLQSKLVATSLALPIQPFSWSKGFHTSEQAAITSNLVSWPDFGLELLFHCGLWRTKSTETLSFPLFSFELVADKEQQRNIALWTKLAESFPV